MPNYSEKIQKFLGRNAEDDHTGNMGSGLAEKAIEQFGGEAAFLDVWEGVCDSIIGVSGWTDEVALTAFYNNNRDEILKFLDLVADEEGYNTLSDAMVDWDYLKGKYTVNDVKKGLYESSSKQHKFVAGACAMCIGQETARYYKMFIDNEDGNE
ncbi:MAG: hypothetical protein J6N72_02665 [Psychrobacter sp.]|nr:hypothetical protein [Psychrobacter sp.]